MGCASSKQTICHHCQTPYSSLPTSYSGPLNHPRPRKGKTRHAASFSSSTLDSLLPEGGIHVDDQITVDRPRNKRYITDGKIKEFVTEVLEAKNWSSMIEDKIPRVIPRTPTKTPPGEPETINTWELMEGLDDYSPLHVSDNLDGSFSFRAGSTGIDQPKLAEEDISTPVIGHSKPKLLEKVTESPKPQWLQMMEDDSVSDMNQFTSDFDPEIVSQFRKALEEISPVAALNLKSPECEKAPVSIRETDYLSNDLIAAKEGNDITECDLLAEDPLDTINGNDCIQKDIVDTKELNDIRENDFLSKNFIDIKEVNEIRENDCVPKDILDIKEVTDIRENDFLSKDLLDTKEGNDISLPTKCPTYGEDRVVIYFTSLRAVRKTYEDCCLVRTIFKGFGVRVDERDVSMHYGFREELKELSGDGTCCELPRVFVKGRHIGGAEEIKQLNEDEKLEKLVEGFAMVEGYELCELCGDVRFVPCESCSGSCKIYCEDGDEMEGEDMVGEFKKCPDCNENGIVRCHVCCY